VTADRRPLQDTVRDLLDAVSGLPEGVDLNRVRCWKVRLLCPRGHFCIDLAVIELRDDLVMLCPVEGLAKPEFVSEFSEIANAAQSRPARGTSGWIRQSGNRVGVHSRAETVVECSKKRCDSRRGRSYTGTFEYFALADEVRLATTAAARRGVTPIEYRLTE
jgi:hypothetical protein